MPPRDAILIVDDCPENRGLVAAYLEQQGYTVHEAEDGAAYRARLAELAPALALIDIELPDTDGLTLALETRRQTDAGIIFVTVRDNDFDRIAALELGGDDYLTKPVNLRELLARVRSVLRRRAAGLVAPGARLPVGGYELDLLRRELLRRDGARVETTQGELNLLAALAAHRGEPVSREYLLQSISPRDPSEVSERTVDTLVRRLRRKLEPDPDNPTLIVTVHGVGYRLGGDVNPG